MQPTSAPRRPPPHEVAYPGALRDREEALVAERRRRAGVATSAPRVGVALSGGGIRSATLSLGFFQAIARAGRLARIDYLSTVSGGSYFGGFLGGLFVPRPPDGPRDVARTLADPASDEVCWLRQNGRYLTPRAGDTLIGVATYLRNLISVHVVMSTLLLAIALAVLAVRAQLWHWGFTGGLERRLVELTGSGLWPSPVLVLPVAALGVAVVPLGWAFWLMPAPTGRLGVFPLLATLVVAVGGAVLADRLPGPGGALACMGSAVACATLVWASALAALALWHGGDSSVDQARFARNRASAWLSRALVLAAVLLAYGVVDSLGQTVWAVVRRRLHADTGWSPWSIVRVLPAAVIPLAPVLARRLFERRAPRDQRPSLRVSALAGVAATLVLIVHGTLLAAAAHAVVWELVQPGAAPALVARLSGAGGPLAAPAPGPVWAAAAGALLLAWLLGQGWKLVNLSTFQALYAGRLTRAYLGASNGRRRDAANQRVSDPVPGDDIELPSYRPHAHGGPLHLVNVTINETVSGESQTEYRDRKGIGLAIGPAGLSVGVRHHALWEEPATRQASGWRARLPEGLRASSPPSVVRPVWERGQEPGSRFHLFAWDDRAGSEVESLPLGSWIGISGAALGTGVGYRTSLALSVLAGFFNLRLGYWWDAGIDPRRRPHATSPGAIGTLGRLGARLFPAQRALLDEWLARFPGPARRRWNVSDGGHFENTGAYELVRRRVPFIVLLDNAEDQDHRFDDLAGLVRKARIDFGAHIRFVGAAGLTRAPAWIRDLFAVDAARWVGGIDDLAPRADGPLGGLRSAAHAALASVTYEDSGEETWLLAVKPGLTGDEPLDVVQYQRAHPQFPQQPTTDQFFDEAQWESYRRLGEHMGTKLFG